ncbi:hypothetical protein BGZ76_010968 [Entomortierella beljakovae]|nr:hypothetical protein BGZ76_010968 [Entomortierella beljakovae]
MRVVPFWKNPDHRIPTLGLYRAILKTCQTLPKSCVDQPGKQRRPIPKKSSEIGPPEAYDPMPKIRRSYIFAHIRDCFRTNRYCTSPRITAMYLKEAEQVLEKLEMARDGDRAARNELKDLVNGRSGRLKVVIDHLHDLINFDDKKTTQRERYDRLKRAQEQVWDTRTQSSIKRDSSRYYRIPLRSSLFSFPPELDYYPPKKFPTQKKNQRGKFKNFGGVFLTEVTTAEGSRFPRIRGGTQPTWISMMLKSRVQNSVKRVDEWKSLENTKEMMELEEKFNKSLGIDDSGYVEIIDERLQYVKRMHAKKFDTNSRYKVSMDDIDDADMPS